MEFLVLVTDCVDDVAARTYDRVRIGFPDVCPNAVDVRLAVLEFIEIELARSERSLLLH